MTLIAVVFYILLVAGILPRAILSCFSRMTRLQRWAWHGALGTLFVLGPFLLDGYNIIRTNAVCSEQPAFRVFQQYEVSSLKRKNVVRKSQNEDGPGYTKRTDREYLIDTNTLLNERYFYQSKTVGPFDYLLRSELRVFHPFSALDRCSSRFNVAEFLEKAYKINLYKKAALTNAAY